MKVVIFFQKCSKEVFLESLLIPALKSGELGKLTDQMVMLDPSLEKWNPYLTATCRYLVKHRLFRVLYEFQIFMKVIFFPCICMSIDNIPLSIIWILSIGTQEFHPITFSIWNTGINCFITYMTDFSFFFWTRFLQFLYSIFFFTEFH